MRGERKNRTGTGSKKTLTCERGKEEKEERFRREEQRLRRSQGESPGGGRRLDASVSRSRGK